jgi:hypothetical protein
MEAATKVNASKAGLLACTLAGIAGVQLPAVAGELLPLEEIPKVDGTLINSCAPYGDFVACSTAVLGYVTGDKKLFSIKASQGFISQDSVIAVYADGAQAQVNPTVGGKVVMDNAYQTSAGNKTGGFSTNKLPSGAEQGVGVTPEPDPNTDGAGGNADDFAGDANDYWDIQLTSLLAALTSAGQVRDPVFVFDNNQLGNTSRPDIKLWGLLAVRDLFDATGNPQVSPLADLVFEFRGCDADAVPGGASDPFGCDAQTPTVLDPNNNSTNPSTPSTFITAKSLGDDPLLDQYAAVQRQFCVDAAFNEVVCPSGNPPGIAKFDQNLGTGDAEFFGFLPDLTGSALQALLAKGYDTLSVDMRFFDQTDGFEDLFILAMGSRNTTPEPGSLALLGGAGVGFAALRRRRQAA